MDNNFMPDMGDLEDMHPEIYRQLRPFVDQVADSYAGEALDADALDQMAAEAVSSSGIARRMPRGHSVATANDFARSMLLGALVSRYGFPFFPYYSFFPFARPFRRGGFRRGERR